MRNFWFWFAFMTAAWVGFAMELQGRLPDGAGVLTPERLVPAALFFAAYFLAPVARTKPAVQTGLLTAAALASAVALWPSPGSESESAYALWPSLEAAAGSAVATATAAAVAANPYPLLVFSLLAGEAVYRLPPIHASVVGAAAFAAAAAPGWAGAAGALPPLFTAVYAAALGSALAIYASLAGEREAAHARGEALLSEYRRLKRRQVTDEEAVRHEARVQVGRNIHDSVGHRLTALLMQLESHRLKADEETKRMLDGLKQLAKDSLEETRSAVKAMSREEEAGLPAILALIRKLESESFMRIQFTVKDGALSAPLNTAQSIAVYRAVQEALTNAMRHGAERSADVTFESPGGGTVFRFEVANRMKNDAPVPEGFGLTSMRDRVREAGGQLEAEAEGGRFTLQGTFPLTDKGAKPR